jgi:hypothetical protein
MESHRGDKGYFFTTTDDYIVFLRGFFITRTYDGSRWAEEAFYPSLRDNGLESMFYTISSYNDNGRLDSVKRKLVFNNAADASVFMNNSTSSRFYAQVDNVVYLDVNRSSIMDMVMEEWNVSHWNKPGAVAMLERGGFDSGYENNHNIIDYFISDGSISGTAVPIPPPTPTSTPTPTPSNVSQDPYMGNAAWLGGEINSIHTFYVVGNSDDSVWGTDVYTDDSIIATAAVHAGVIGIGEAGTVTIRLLPGRESYEGTTRNGVTTRSYGSWNGSYEFVR